MSTAEITTILGKGSAFEGKLTFEGTVRIDGTFAGEIRTDGTLIVGPTADVRATITAATLVVEGRVQGELCATEAIEILAPAQVHGNLHAPSLQIEKGSIFEGNCHMAEVTSKDRVPVQVASAQEQAANSTDTSKNAHRGPDGEASPKGEARPK